MATGSITKDYSQVDKMAVTISNWNSSSGVYRKVGFVVSGSFAKYKVDQQTAATFSGNITLSTGSLQSGGTYYAYISQSSTASPSSTATPVYNHFMGYYTGGTTITFNANGGSGAPGSITTYWAMTSSLNSFFANSIPNTIPTRSGYTFLGWSNSSSATTATWTAGQAYPDGLSSTLYAVWKANANMRVKVSGSWKSATSVFVKASGTWKQSTGVKIKVNNSWVDGI